MRTYLSVLFICSLLVGVIYGQDIQGSVAPNSNLRDPNYRDPLETLRTVSAARVPNPMRQHVLLVMDISSSMDSRLLKAVAVAQAMAQRNFDDYFIGIITFNGKYARWAGVPDEKGEKPDGWASVPTHQREVCAYLNSLKAGSSTDPDAALSAAFSDPQQLLTIVLITDGEFNSGTNALAAVQAGIKYRDDRKLPSASLMMIGIGTSSEKQASFSVLQNVALGGFYVQD